jgi:hypothetical protein
MWGDTWGDFLWGATASVPVLTQLGLVLWVLLLLGTGLFLQRRHLPPLLSSLIVVGIIAIPLATLAAVTLPNPFVDGTVASGE